MTKHEALAEITSTLREEVPDITGVMIASNEGLSIVTDFSEDEAPRIAAVCAAASGLGGRIAQNASLGAIDEVFVRGEQEQLVVYISGAAGVLAVRAPALSNLGLVRLEASAAAKKIAAVLNV